MKSRVATIPKVPRAPTFVSSRISRGISTAHPISSDRIRSRVYRPPVSRPGALRQHRQSKGWRTAILLSQSPEAPSGRRRYALPEEKDSSPSHLEPGGGHPPDRRRADSLLSHHSHDPLWLSFVKNTSDD